MFIQFTGLVQRTPSIDADDIKHQIKGFMYKQFCMLNFNLKCEHEEPEQGYGSAVKIFSSIECNELALDEEEVERKLGAFISDTWYNEIKSLEQTISFAYKGKAEVVTPSENNIKA